MNRQSLGTASRKESLHDDDLIALRSFAGYRVQVSTGSLAFGVISKIILVNLGRERIASVNVRSI